MIRLYVGLVLQNYPGIHYKIRVPVKAAIYIIGKQEKEVVLFILFHDIVLFTDIFDSELSQ